MSSVPAARVLIVDDEPSGREALRSLLVSPAWKGTPPETVLADNGDEAIRLATELDPDLILLDIMMPGIDGVETCRRLRATPGLAEVPIVMVTALDDRALRLEALDAGADDFVTKPLDRAEVRARFATILRLDRHRRLQDHQARLQWVVEQALDGYLLIDATGRVLYANPRAQRLLDLQDDPTGASFPACASPTYHLEPGEAWASRPRGEGAVTQRFLVRPEEKDSAALWLAVDEFADARHREPSRIIRLRDVTAEVVVSSEIRALHRTLAHKFRTPLNGILGSLSVLTDLDDGASPEDFETFLPILSNTAERLRSTVETLLVHLDLPTATLDGEHCDLADLPGIVEALSAEANLQMAPLLVPPELRDKTVPLSTRALEFVLGELLDNAVKFHPAHTPALAISLHRAPDSATACLCVGDDCPRLPVEDLGRVWTPYFQSEKRATGEVPGLGLGLSTIAAIVWGVGGTCTMRHRCGGVGNVAEICLPVGELASPAAP